MPTRDRLNWGTWALTETPALEELRRLSRLLVIDDKDFPLMELFRADGYYIDKWDDVERLTQLSQSEYDVILLDLHGVGTRFSDLEGLGLLKEIRRERPEQAVVVYSNNPWSFKYQELVRSADRAIDKDAQYAEFRATVDDVLMERISPPYLYERIRRAVGPDAGSRWLERRVHRAVTLGKSRGLAAYLKKRLGNRELADKLIRLAEVAARLSETAQA